MKLFKKDYQQDRTHLLILGLPRSGTSILASLIGAHSNVSLICEDFGRSWIDAIGKPVVGNKLCVPRQIDMDRKRNMGVKLLNRVGLLKLWPKSMLSIEDYLEIDNLKLILIRRELSDVRNSMGNRDMVTLPTFKGEVKTEEISEEEIEYTIEKGSQILSQLEQRDNAFTISFDELINQTEPTLQTLCDFIGVSYEEQMIEEGPRWNWVYPEISAKGIDKSKAGKK
ncbi:sulfotransferase [Aliifodinibius sp. S!AR15-10]|uniref:sulfotransferase domain-containing protein n=1 Tax=Aliifodinibius sp. S!AR15-10 TaxID=2950437 RepID=UPI00286014E7|nr:sulfotransferase domain-containing protein [Aliifodinibius sp. S!AR15-10]MDR8394069.1 sulfotransferase [Aliifodinibius sp. S!AR15-10]